MAPIPKKAMLSFTLQNSRGIMCANVAGKVVAKAVRSKPVGLVAWRWRQEDASMGLCHEEAPSVPRTLAGFSSKKLRGRDALQQCFSQTWPALSTLLFRSWLWEHF